MNEERNGEKKSFTSHFTLKLVSNYKFTVLDLELDYFGTARNKRQKVLHRKWSDQYAGVQYW